MTSLAAPVDIKETIISKENIARDLDAISTPMNASRIMGSLLLEHLDITVEAINSNPRLQSPEAKHNKLKALSSPVTTRPHVFVAEQLSSREDDLTYVNNVSTFRKMLESLLDVTRIMTYTGSDASEVYVYQARLPENYVAGIPYVRMKHIPSRARHEGKVSWFPLYNNTGSVDMLSQCRSLTPYRTDMDVLDITRAEIRASYHSVTIKVNMETGIIRRWNPGVDIYSSGYPTSSMDQWVLLGESRPKKS